MRARFLLGGAGSGKTHRCLAEARDELARAPLGPPVLLFVPEQATYQVERALLEGLPGGATFRGAVLSFKRLAHRLSIAGQDHQRRPIGDLGRQMLIRKILSRRASELALFSNSGLEPGLVAQLSQTILELRQYCVTTEQLREWLRRANDQKDRVLYRKLSDLAILYQDYLDACANEVLDETELPERICQAIPTSSWLEGARLWVDGFSDFTRQELAILKSLFARVPEVTIALAMEAGPDGAPLAPADRARLFAKAGETLERLRRELPGGTTEEYVSLPTGDAPPRFRSPDLLHVATRMFSNPVPWDGGRPRGVLWIEAANRRAEVTAAAAEIRRLVRDEGYRYRDISVIVRGLDEYAELVDAVFGDQGIPFFLDRRKGVAHHPLVELIRAAVNVVTDGWHYDHVLLYLRSGFMPIAPHWIDAIDNHAIEHGIRGDAWLDPKCWVRPSRQVEANNPADAEPSPGAEPSALDQARQKALAPLAAFSRRLDATQGPGGELCVREFAAALDEMLEALLVPDQLAKWSADAAGLGQLELAEEHSRVWDGVVELLDEMVAALGDDPCGRRELARVLEAGLSALTLGLVPPAIDEVLVGSIERSRQPEIRAAFLLGLNERIFPLVGDEDPILNDADRASLADDIELAPGSEQRFFQETYLGYIAFTRASDRLWISYATADEKGREMLPSPFIDRLRRCFPEWQPTRVSGDFTSMEWISTPRDFAAGLVAALRAPETSTDQRATWLAAYEQARQIPRVAALLGRVLPSLTYANSAQLSPEISRELFGPDLSTSISRLETFAACPFQHFARYGLRLAARKPFRLDPLIEGNFAHEVLRIFLELSGDRPWCQLSLAEAEECIQQATAQVTATLRDRIFLDSARNRHVAHQIERDLRLFVKMLLAEARRSGFRPHAAELAFGADSPLPPLEYDLPGGARLHLEGKIDRVDVACQNGVTHVRTIDYKSGKRAINYAELSHGLSLQLLIYLRAVLAHANQLNLEGARPAGAFYSRLTLPATKLPRRSREPSTTDEELFERLKLRGVISESAIDLLDSDLRTNKTTLFYQVKLRADGAVADRAKSDAIREPEMEALLALVENHVVRMGGQILAGEIGVAPFNLGGKSPCKHCDFQPVCRRERHDPERVLLTKNKLDLLADITSSEPTATGGREPKKKRIAKKEKSGR